jgi:hypothetical protein
MRRTLIILLLSSFCGYSQTENNQIEIIIKDTIKISQKKLQKHKGFSEITFKIKNVSDKDILINKDIFYKETHQLSEAQSYRQTTFSLSDSIKQEVKIDFSERISEHGFLGFKCKNAIGCWFKKNKAKRRFKKLAFIEGYKGFDYYEKEYCTKKVVLKAKKSKKMKTLIFLSSFLEKGVYYLKFNTHKEENKFDCEKHLRKNQIVFNDNVKSNKVVLIITD